MSEQGEQGGRADERGRPPEPDPFRPFVSTRGRLVGLLSAGGSVAVFGGVAALMPGPSQGGGWALGDRVICALVGVAIAWLLVRYATIRATPGREALRVRNLLVTREIPWSQVGQVRFGDGDPWVSLDLAGHETLAVMAIQRADGPRSRAEASRLASLVQALADR